MRWQQADWWRWRLLPADCCARLCVARAFATKCRRRARAGASNGHKTTQTNAANTLQKRPHYKKTNQKNQPNQNIPTKPTTNNKTGDKAKFGLRAREIVAAVNRLEDEGMLDCLQLLHFHSGSQITSIREVKEVMRESSFLYAELVKVCVGRV